MLKMWFSSLTTLAGYSLTYTSKLIYKCNNSSDYYLKMLTIQFYFFSNVVAMESQKQCYWNSHSSKVNFIRVMTGESKPFDLSYFDVIQFFIKREFSAILENKKKQQCLLFVQERLKLVDYKWNSPTFSFTLTFTDHLKRTQPKQKNQ